MKLAIVGVGNAGSRIVNRILEVERETGRDLCRGNTLLVNSTQPSFETTEHVPEERRLVIGDVFREVDGEEIDGDPDLAAEVAREERHEINRAFDLIEFHQVDGVLVVAGLAGGTGGGAGAVVIDLLKAICDEPVYAVGVLPGESEGSQAALNAARSLQSFVTTADNVIAFDNDAWDAENASGDAGAANDAAEADGTHGDAADAPDGLAEDAAPDGPDEDAPGDVLAEDAPGDGYAHVNVALADRVVTLFAAGEFQGASAPENRLDPSDVIRTLDVGGVSSIGYASTDLPRTGGVRAWFRTWHDRLPWTPDREEGDEEEPTDAAKINRLVRRAARSTLTLPCEVSSADRALIVLSGPSRALSRKGFESGRYWLEGAADIVDVMAGDVPHDRSSTLTAVVLFSNVTDVPRIDALQEQAVGEGAPSSTGEMRFGQANPP